MKGLMLATCVMPAIAAAACAEPSVVGSDDVTRRANPRPPIHNGACDIRSHNPAIPVPFSPR